MSVQLKKVNRDDAEIWLGMLSEELFGLPERKARNILIAEGPLEKLEISVEGKRVGFVALDVQPKCATTLLWIFILKTERRKGYATQTLSQVVTQYGRTLMSNVPRVWADCFEERFDVERLEGGDEYFVDVSVGRPA